MRSLERLYTRSIYFVRTKLDDYSRVYIIIDTARSCLERAAEVKDLCERGHFSRMGSILVKKAIIGAYFGNLPFKEWFRAHYTVC